jgi:hypothetical protein
MPGEEIPLFLKEIIQDGNLPDYEMFVADKIGEFRRGGLKRCPGPTHDCTQAETLDKAQTLVAQKCFRRAA